MRGGDNASKKGSEKTLRTRERMRAMGAIAWTVRNGRKREEVELWEEERTQRKRMYTMGVITWVTMRERERERKLWEKKKLF